MLPLNAVNGPVLTIEGRDAAGQPCAWYVRLWNYAVGSPSDALVTLDFDTLAGGFLLPSEADPVWAGDIDRLFISLVPPGYTGIDAPLTSGQAATVTLSNIACDGPGSTITVGDAFVPPHSLRIASGYDDSYNLTPARLLRGMVQMGYTGVINHYVGMSHYPVLTWNGARFVADPARPICQPASAWHADFAARARVHGFELILSLSFELLDQHCPEGWKQRDASANPALTGWSPPSTLLSPCHPAAMAYLTDVARAFTAIAIAANQRVRFQLGEPWWWVGANQRLCAYDTATTAAYAAETGKTAPVLPNIGISPCRRRSGPISIGLGRHWAARRWRCAMRCALPPLLPNACCYSTRRKCCVPMHPILRARQSARRLGLSGVGCAAARGL